MMGAVCFVPVVFIVEFSAIFILHSSAARFLHYHHDTLVVELSAPPSQPPARLLLILYLEYKESTRAFDPPLRMKFLYLLLTLFSISEVELDALGDFVLTSTFTA